MTNRFSTEDQRAALKTAWNLLVRRLGTKEFTLDLIAAEITRLSKPCLSKAGNPAEDYFAPIDAVLDLEQAAGRPLVTEMLARCQGYRLVPMTAPDGVDLVSETLTASAAMGRWAKDVQSAMTDGRLTLAEREALREEAKANADFWNGLHDTLANRDGVVAPLKRPEAAHG